MKITGIIPHKTNNLDLNTRTTIFTAGEVRLDTNLSQSPTVFRNSSYTTFFLFEEGLQTSNETFQNPQVKLNLSYADITNYLVASILPADMNKHQLNKFKRDAKFYIWDDPYLWRICSDQIIRRCIPDDEFESVLTFCHTRACGEHFSAKRTARKVLESGLFWPNLFRDAHEFCKKCSRCQFVGNISRKHEMPQQPL